jgi:NAD-dependent DNA ligase
MATNTFKELDIVKYINPEELEVKKPEYGTKLAELYGIIRDSYRDTVYVEFIKKNGKTLDIVNRPINELERVGALYDLIKKGSTPIIINNPVKVKAENNNTDVATATVKVRKPRKTKAKSDIDISTTSTKLNGLRILPTGLFDHFSRSGFVDSIINNGGIYGSGGVNKKLDILVVGRAAGPAKINKAKELGIRMIDEATYLEMIK